MVSVFIRILFHLPPLARMVTESLEVEKIGKRYNEWYACEAQTRHLKIPAEADHELLSWPRPPA